MSTRRLPRRLLAQFLAFIFTRRQSFVHIDALFLLLCGRRTCGRKAERDALFSPLQFHISPEVSGWLIAVSAKFIRLDFALFSDEQGESIRPLIEVLKDVRLRRHIFGLIIAVLLSPPELFVAPKPVWNFDAAVTTLPHNRRVSFSLVFKRFFFRFEVIFVAQEFWSAVLVQLIAPAIALTVKPCRSAFEMIPAQTFPLRRVFEPHRQLRVFVFDQIFARIAAAHAD